MRWAVGLLVVAVLGVVVALVLAVGSTRDPVPERVRACALDGQAGVVRGPADLSAQVRSDIEAGAIRRGPVVQLGEDDVVLLTGTNYRILVLKARASPPLDGDLPRRVYDRAPAFALVAKEIDPIRGVLQGCIALVSGR